MLNVKKLKNIKNMKRKLFIFFLTAITVLCYTKCENKLDTTPLGELNSETFYKNENDFEAASLAPYSTILDLYYDQSGLGWFNSTWLVSDDARQPRGTNSNAEFTWLPSNGDFSWIWENCYKGIMRANVILDRLPAADAFADENNKKRFEGEARFIRAYFNFILARNWGTPPVVPELITKLEDANLPNSQPGEIWDLIESDLKYAIANLPDEWDTDNLGRATSYAAMALLGKAMLFRAQWEGNDAKYGEALQQFNAVISSDKYMLLSNFGDNFKESMENNEESVFEIQMSPGDANPWLPTDFGLEQNQNVGSAGTGRKIYSGAACDEGNCAPGANAYGYGAILPTSSLQDEFETDDARLYDTNYFDPNEEYSVNGDLYNPLWSFTKLNVAKYIHPFDPSGFPNNYSGNNERIIRYADVLLMAAECELLGNGDVTKASSLINQVRKRARDYYEVVNGTPAPSGTLPDRPDNVSVDQMMQWLMHERRVELAHECHRYDDLVRWHRAGIINIKNDIVFGSQVANQNWSEKNLIKPIPQREIDNNPNLKQNDGY